MSGKRERGISYGPTVKLNYGHGDDEPGGSNNFGTGAPLYGGILGIEIEFTDSQVYSDTSVNTLYGGIYKRVKLASASSPGVLGCFAFWSDADNYVVTLAPSNGNHAGVFINTTVTAGKYCWIQVGGLASVLMNGRTTKATPAIKDVIVVESGSFYGDIEDDATPYTNLIYKRIAGIAEEVPVADALCLVQLLDRFSNPFK